MRVFVVSDTHGSNGFLNKALEEVGHVDYFLHMGDLEGSEYFIDAFVECPKKMIAGNNDFSADFEDELEFELEGHRIFMTHGHRYGVYAGVERLYMEGVERGADIILFGHTHQPFLEEINDTLILNPGSISLPRQKGRRPSYAIMDLKENGEVEVEVKYL